MDKKTKKPATRKKAVKAVEASENQPETSTLGNFPPYNSAAWNWMCQESIPGAFSPILYIGTEVSMRISQLLGRSMLLEEAQHLVQPDGKMATCAAEGKKFQPVKYVPFLPKNLEAQLAKGETLMEIPLPYGGAYYINKNQELVAFSGSVFHYNPRKQDYEWCHTSPLVIAAEEIRKITGRMQWGVPFDTVNKMVQSRAENQERRKKISSLVTSLLPTRKGLGRGEDGFKKARRNG
ncbi:MAG: hypothetical protein Q8Q03_01420 [bacterium]|nr:hypothetical protein [bacterium]